MKIKLVSVGSFRAEYVSYMTKEQEAMSQNLFNIKQHFFNSLTEIEAKIPEYLKYEIAVVVL